MTLKKELIGILCLVTALVIFSVFAGKVLTTKRLDYGATWDMYLKEPENTVDVLFYGSSLAYCDIAPGAIYDETGLATYVMAGPEQSFAVTYRYLLESCRTQHPQAVFIEATRIAAPTNNRSLKVNLTYMPWTKNRLIPTFEEAEGNERWGLLFPLYGYHDRWDNLTADDWRIGFFGYEADPMAGYTPLDRVFEAEEPYFEDVTELGEGYADGLKYAELIAEFCREENIQLVFFFSPVTQRINAESMAQIQSDLNALGIAHIDFNEEREAIGLDRLTDFGDNQHTNLTGADKFSRYLAHRLSDYGVAPGGQADAVLWQQRADAFAQKLAEAAEGGNES